jgi:hypothetical protein
VFSELGIKNFSTFIQETVMCCLTKRKSKCIGGMTLLLLLALAANLSAAEAQKPEKSKLTSPTVTV